MPIQVHSAEVRIFRRVVVVLIEASPHWYSEGISPTHIGAAWHRSYLGRKPPLVLKRYRPFGLGLKQAKFVKGIVTVGARLESV